MAGAAPPGVTPPPAPRGVAEPVAGVGGENSPWAAAAGVTPDPPREVGWGTEGVWKPPEVGGPRQRRCLCKPCRQDVCTQTRK